MKIKLILLAILFSFNVLAAEKVVTNQAVIILNNELKKEESVKQISFKSTAEVGLFSVNPYYTAFTQRHFDFDSAGVGLESSLNVSKNTSIDLDLLGKDDTEEPLIDRVGVGFTAKLINKKRFDIYGKGGLGYWTLRHDFDAVVRGGFNIKVHKNFKLFSDLGFGSLFNGVSYKQVRAGVGISF